MKKAILLSIFLLLLTVTVYSNNIRLTSTPAVPQTAMPIDPIFPGVGVITSRNMADGRLATSNQAIFGPNICIDYGDPYSPLASIYAPGPYTYKFRIRIPADYPANIVRIELFDPDSINQALNDFSISRSNTAINNGLPATDSKICGTSGGSSSQIHPCLLLTDELDLVNGAPNLDLDQINPYWFVRIDEHRGAGDPPGNGSCGNPATYNPLYNTNTLFALSYYRLGTNETLEEVSLVNYVGQTGDGVRDSGDHNTDMRWVSPGADVPFSTVDDPGSPVPAIAGTIDSFEVNLTTDVPNIVTDAQTGDRYLYLGVTALSGASENGYELWAGPPDYVNSVPSEVNARNLHILNNPGSHHAQGVEITAVNTLLQNSNISNPVNIPLATIGPEAAGQTLQLTMFDSDSGAQPPIVFYFDSIAFTPDGSNPLGYDPDSTDWAMAFAVSGQDDPDGVAEGVRCVPGSCQTQWVNPSYQITIPGDLRNCDWQNPTAEACTPFYGGRLMVRYDGGFSDTYAWELPSTQGELPDNSTTGCTAFPITIHEGIRSVTAPGTGAIPYPDAAEFDYPATPPTFSSFLNHQSDIPLLNATPGDLYVVQNGFGSGNFGWLAWNEGIVPSANTLANSLTWPGDSSDYTDHSDGGTPIPGSGFAHVVRGYIEPGDPTDQALHIGDWIAASIGSLSDTAVQDQLNEHIDLGRMLRLPIWDNANLSANGRYQVTQFGIFRIIGYNITIGWLLLEFVNFDSSCGQPPVPPTAVTIAGPNEGAPDTSYNFTASVTPTITTTPITYTWEISDQDTITTTGSISNTVSLSWGSAGSKGVMVTAVNNSGLSVSQSHTIEIIIPNQKLYLPFINNN